MSDEIGQRDLLGDPYRELSDGRGRPKHRVTPETRWKVSALRAAGMSRGDIADVIGVSGPTLAKYYFFELNEGVARERAEAVFLLRESARSGNVSAQKALLALYDRGDTAPRVPVDPTEKLGKKEQLRQDARDGHESTSWGSLIPH